MVNSSRDLTDGRPRRNSRKPIKLQDDIPAEHDHADGNASDMVDDPSNSDGRSDDLHEHDIESN